MEPHRSAGPTCLRKSGRPLLRTCIAFVAILFLPAGPISADSLSPTRIEYLGTLHYEAHFRHPGDVRPYHSREVYSTDGRGSARLDWTTWEDGDTVFIPETYLLAGDRVFHRDTPADAWQECRGARALRGRLQASAGIPAALQSAMEIGHPEFGRLWIRSQGRVERFTRLWPHPRLGDVRDTVAFAYAGDELAPDSLTLALYMRDSNWRLTGRRVSWSSAPQPDSLFSIPARPEPMSPNEEDDSLAVMSPLVEVAPGIWSADLDDIDSRTLIVEFTDHLAVIETAVGSANGERIVDAIHRKWPAKPIRVALFSHYHPHYTGGLRALIAEGATVVTTPGNEAFVQRISEYPFTLEPDRLAMNPRDLRMVTFADRHEISDATNQLVAFNYGPRSDHTDEFVLFWFPRQKLLFETEQGWVGSGDQLRAGRRAKNLLAWIAEQKLDVERFVQGWPMRDTAAILTRAELDSLVQVKR